MGTKVKQRLQAGCVRHCTVIGTRIWEPEEEGDRASLEGGMELKGQVSKVSSGTVITEQPCGPQHNPHATGLPGLTCDLRKIPHRSNSDFYTSPGRGPHGSEHQGMERAVIIHHSRWLFELAQNQPTSRCKHWLGVHCLSLESPDSQIPRAWLEGTHHVSRSILNSDPRMAVIADHDLIGGHPVTPKRK